MNAVIKFHLMSVLFVTILGILAPSQKVGVEAFGFFNNDFFKGIGNGIGNGIGDHIKKINFNGLLTSVVSGGGKHHPPSPPQPEIPAEQDSQPIPAASEKIENRDPSLFQPYVNMVGGAISNLNPLSQLGAIGSLLNVQSSGSKQQPQDDQVEANSYRSQFQEDMKVNSQMGSDKSVFSIMAADEENTNADNDAEENRE